ncbi:L-carnitine dehydratase/bile acid-inducible protein F [Bordetella pertussis]|nr:L-carnitine dehydratase/bile acid-inducible protein F [Bordetella pertussis]
MHASLLHAQIAMMDFQAARYLNDGDVPAQEGNDHPTSSPMGLFAASDGMFNLGASGEGNWKRFCQVLGQTGWLADPRFQTEKLRVRNRRDLNALIGEVFAGGTVAHWVGLLNEAGVPAGPVYTVPQMFDDAQVRHLDVARRCQAWQGGERVMITQPVTLARTPARHRPHRAGLGRAHRRSAARSRLRRRRNRQAARGRRGLNHKGTRSMSTDTHPPGRLAIDDADGLLRVRIVNPARYNAMSLSMWKRWARRCATRRAATICAPSCSKARASAPSCPAPIFPSSPRSARIPRRSRAMTAR